MNGSGNLIRTNVFLRPASNPYSSISYTNRSQALDDTGLNRWNDSVGGNYWSERTAPDADSDGIVDQPYALDGGLGAMDYRPLVDQP
ncbi:MAG: hypothetical protein ABR986_02025 [Methanomassiliicoccales archaeon]